MFLICALSDGCAICFFTIFCMISRTNDSMFSEANGETAGKTNGEDRMEGKMVRKE